MQIWAAYNTEPWAMMGGEMNPELERFEIAARWHDLSEPLDVNLWAGIFAFLNHHTYQFRSMSVGDIICQVEGESILKAWRCQNLGWCEVQPEYLTGRIGRHPHMVDIFN